MAKRKFTQADETIALDRLRRGTLRVDCDAALAWRRVGLARWLPLTTYPGGRAGEYQFVRLYDKGTRRQVALHRLVWMAKTGEPIPDGCEVHHKYGPSQNGWPALECKTEAEHRALHQGESAWD